MIDTHAHLQESEFNDDLAQTINNAKHSGVNRIINVGTNLDSSKKAVALSEKYENLYAAIGLHPHDAKQWNNTISEEFLKLGRNPKVVAVGEVGLDFFKNLSTEQQQVAALEDQLEIARGLSLPVCFHIRDAFSRLKEVVGNKPPKGAIHCFTGTKDEAKTMLDLGFYISFSGILTFKNADWLREVATYVPEDRILLETDCPFLAPEPYRGKRNEPAYITSTARVLAGLREKSLDEIDEITTNNTERQFFKS